MKNKALYIVCIIIIFTSTIYLLLNNDYSPSDALITDIPYKTNPSLAVNNTKEKPPADSSENIEAKDPPIPLTGNIDMPKQMIAGIPLSLNATALLSNDKFRRLTWSVKDAGTTKAVITSNTLYATDSGIVVVLAELSEGQEADMHYSEEFIITVNLPESYDFTVYLIPDKTIVAAGDTVQVDVMLVGSINYVMVMGEIIYDAALFDYIGYTHLSGQISTISEESPHTVSMRVMATNDFKLGVPCNTDKRIVTLKFRAKNDFTASSNTGKLDFGSLFVAPAGNAKNALTAPAESLIITINK